MKSYVKKLRKVADTERRKIDKHLTKLVKNRRTRRDNISEAANLLTDAMDILAKEFSFLDLEQLIRKAVRTYVEGRVKDLRRKKRS